MKTQLFSCYKRKAVLPKNFHWIRLSRISNNLPIWKNDLMQYKLLSVHFCGSRSTAPWAVNILETRYFPPFNDFMQLKKETQISSLFYYLKKSGRMAAAVCWLPCNCTNPISRPCKLKLEITTYIPWVNKQKFKEVKQHAPSVRKKC